VIKGIIFDCFGVLIANDLKARVDAVAKVNPDSGRALHDIMKARDRGMLGDQEYIQHMAQYMNVDPESLRRGIDSSLVKNTELTQFIRTLRQDFKVALLSNVSGRHRLEELFSPGELDELFEVVVASGDVGIIKPEREIYELTAEKLGVAPEECVMIDDLPQYCDGANAVGMKAIQFQNTEQAIRDLRALIDTQS
jgi:epoxide hydrolase-like predicted phosphatase